ncbi:hypothetical protein [Aureimonas sp. AU40]|uniref:hypothetical protein n=1 Tax=Aureimonas sp. AU40 TaxID=1637747 RepID=UPI00078621A2|nr:hypothetical protein [Aureimonas sp. AU40]
MIGLFGAAAMLASMSVAASHGDGHHRRAAARIVKTNPKKQARRAKAQAGRRAAQKTRRTK